MQTRSSILNSTTGLDAKKQFENLVEDCISRVQNKESKILRYQNNLNKAGAKLDFVFGIGLYMAPSNMPLNIARHIVGYSNEIQEASEDLMIGRKRKYINVKTIPLDYSSDTGEKSVVVPQTQTKLESATHAFTSNHNLVFNS